MLGGSAMTSYEGCATISTPTGQLAMYSNGEQVWDANHQLMPNGANLGGHNSASQGALLLRAPGSSTLYYLFTVDTIDNNLVGGLRYSIIDLSLRGGLGDVTATKAVRLPTPTLTGKVTEKLTAALHSNGQEYWVVVHGWENNQFYSFHLSTLGLSTTPVVSAVGPVHQGGGSFFGAANAVGYLRISPDGTKLALAQRDAQFEVYNFNSLTGVVSDFVPLTGLEPSNYGVEFSPDNSRLYTTGYSAYPTTTIYQFNLLAGSGASIQASRTVVGSVSGLCVAVQSGFNGKLYLSALNQPMLSTISLPNALGTACSFQGNTVALGQKLGQNGLPNFPSAFSLPILASTAAAGLSAKASVFPNPARTDFTLSLPETMRQQAVLVLVTSLQGQEMVRQTLEAPGSVSSLVVPIGGLAKGVYIVRASSAAGSIEKKLVVE
jgi:hypothetical protein